MKKAAQWMKAKWNAFQHGRKIQKKVRGIRRKIGIIRNNRDAANAALAERVYKQLEREGFFKGWRKESREPRLANVTGGFGHAMMEPEPVKETFMDIGALAHDWKNAATPKEKQRIATAMHQKVDELNGYRAPANDLQKFYRSPTQGAHVENLMISIRMALQHAGYTRAQAKAIAPELFYRTHYRDLDIRKELEKMLPGKAETFMRWQKKYYMQLSKNKQK